MNAVERIDAQDAPLRCRATHFREPPLFQNGQACRNTVRPLVTGMTLFAVNGCVRRLCLPPTRRAIAPKPSPHWSRRQWRRLRPWSYRLRCGALSTSASTRQRQHDPLQSDDCQPDDCARGLAGARQSIARLSRHHAWRAHRRDLRRDVFSHLTSLSPAFFESAGSGGRRRECPPTPPRSRAAAVVSISTALRNFMLIAGASAMMEVSSPRRLERSSRQFR